MNCIWTTIYKKRKEKFVPQPKPHTLHENKLKMYYIFKCKLWKYKTFRKTHERKLWPEIIQRFLIKWHQKHYSQKKKKRKKLDLIKVKTFALLKILLQKIKKKNWQQIGRKYLQITFITMDYILNLWWILKTTLKKYIH